MKNELSQSEWARVDYKGWTDAYRFQTATMTMTVVGDIGARVMEYGVPGRNILWQDAALHGATLREKGLFYPGGSQFDLLNEQGYGISAKDPVLWIGKYIIEIRTPTHLTAISPAGIHSGLQITRDIEVNPQNGEVVITQTVFNRSKQNNKLSIWDRTWMTGPCRLAVPVETSSDCPEGWRFLVSKNGMQMAGPASGNPEAARQFQYADGVLTIQPCGHSCQILIKNSKGWFAYAQDDLLYIKRYAIENGAYPWCNYPASIWLSELDWKNIGLMAEMEPMSPFYDLEPGKSCCFQEKWRLIRLDSPLENPAQLRRTLSKGNRII